MNRAARKRAEKEQRERELQIARGYAFALKQLRKPVALHPTQLADIKGERSSDSATS